MIQKRNKAESKVTTVLEMDENRLFLIHTIGPVVRFGGGREGCISERTYVKSVMVTLPSTFNQRNARVVPIHKERRQQGYREIHQHRQPDDLNRTATLVERSADENVDEF